MGANLEHDIDRKMSRSKSITMEETKQQDAQEEKRHVKQLIDLPIWDSDLNVGHIETVILGADKPVAGEIPAPSPNLMERLSANRKYYDQNSDKFLTKGGTPNKLIQSIQSLTAPPKKQETASKWQKLKNALSCKSV